MEVGYVKQGGLAKSFYLAIIALNAYLLFTLDDYGYENWQSILAIPAGLLLADFVSGLVHWAADTWGSVKTPILGKTIIMSFRNHHIDQESITENDFFDVNGHNVLFSTIPIFLSTYLGGFFRLIFITFGIGIMFTNQIHKWAHMRRAPLLVRILQRYGFILSPQNHNMHHTEPFEENYCITTGWLNRPLKKIGFFRALEKTISRLIGATPRFEDHLLHTTLKKR